MNHQSKKKNEVVSIISSGRGGGGIAGLLVFGGALAVTGLIAVASFASNKNKPKRPKSPAPEPQPQESDDTTNGHPSLLQDSTTDDENACSPSNETSNMSLNQIDSFKLLSTQTLILEEKLDLKVKTNQEEESATGLHQEIGLSDDSLPESAVSSIKNGNGEECMESSFELPSSKAEDAEKSESEDHPKSIGVNEGQFENATTETEEDEEEDVAFEKSENSTEATERTSLDSNEAAVWPAELIEEPQRVRVVKGGRLEEQGRPNISASDSSDGASDSSDSDYVIKRNLRLKKNYQRSLSRTRPSKSGTAIQIFVVMLLAFLLLLLLPLANGEPGHSYVLDVDADNSEYL